jgi:hypothetical protein
MAERTKKGRPAGRTFKVRVLAQRADGTPLIYGISLPRRLVDEHGLLGKSYKVAYGSRGIWLEPVEDQGQASP